MYTARLNTVKNKYYTVSNNPLMDTTKNLSNLQADLSIEQINYNNYSAQNRNLTSQLTKAQNDLTKTQDKHIKLQQLLTNQQNLVQKVHAYLGDYQENNSATQPISNEELAQQLIGNLAQLNLE
ncbi:MAG TPA: hypothetical protein LFW20_06045 [Rickettsia endosymbiont of Omalisus fontisbellaquei]|nr:hypothetical protein [Rickettsia endosymbiont of Omalisus fontisbellaquei]